MRQPSEDLPITLSAMSDRQLLDLAADPSLDPEIRQEVIALLGERGLSVPAPAETKPSSHDLPDSQPKRKGKSFVPLLFLLAALSVLAGAVILTVVSGTNGDVELVDDVHHVVFAPGTVQEVEILGSEPEDMFALVTDKEGRQLAVPVDHVIQVNGSFGWRFFLWHAGGSNPFYYGGFRISGPPPWLVPLTPFQLFILLLIVAYIARRVTHEPERDAD